jgi:hypothetical protein
MPEEAADTSVKTVLPSGAEQAESRKSAEQKPGMTAFGIKDNFCEAKGELCNI